MGLPFITANARFDFSRTMNHPSASAPTDGETWEKALGFYEAKIHWLLGDEPSWVECWFHAGTDRVFPWTRVRLSDEYGIIAVYRLDQVTEEFGDMGRVWKAYGRDLLYGSVDNYLRSPRIYTQPGATDIDPNYTEWNILHPSVVSTCEDLAKKFGPDDERVTSHDCAFETNAERDAYLSSINAESSYATDAQKLGPNYTSKGIRRGWVFKDIHRHAAGTPLAGSRPILGVYNRSDTDLESDIIDSNFSQAQAGGSGANALARDVSITWPWLPEVTGTLPGTTPGDAPIPIAAPETVESGYDYRQVWPGKADPFAGSGQALEVFQRGSQVWDDSVCFSCGEKTPGPGGPPDGPPGPGGSVCPGGGRICYFVTCAQTPYLPVSHTFFDHLPTRAEVLNRSIDTPDVPSQAEQSIIVPATLGTICVISVFDSVLANYNFNRPYTITEWINRHMLRHIPVRRTEFTNDPAGPYIARRAAAGAGRLLSYIESNGCERGPGCEGVAFAFPSDVDGCDGTYDCHPCTAACPPDPRCLESPANPCCIDDICHICPVLCFPCNSEFTNAECAAGGCTSDPSRLILPQTLNDRTEVTNVTLNAPVWTKCGPAGMRVCKVHGDCSVLKCGGCIRAQDGGRQVAIGGIAFWWMTPTIPDGIPLPSESFGTCLGSNDHIAVWTSNAALDGDFLCYEPGV
jgi:hypothetical protein